MDDDMTSHINDREDTASPISMKLESLLLEEMEKLKGIEEDDTISKTTDHIPPVLTPIEPVQAYQAEVVEIYDDEEDDGGNNQQSNTSTALVHRNYSQSQDNGTMKQSSRNQISERRNGSLLLRIQNDLGGDNLRQHLNDCKLKQVKAMELKGLDFLRKTNKLAELEKQQQIDSFKLKHIEGIMRQQEALQKQLKPETKKTKLPEYLVESWGHYAIIQSNRKMSRSGRLPTIPYQKLPLAEYLNKKKNVRPIYLFLKDRQKNNRNLLGKNQVEVQSQQQQQQQQQRQQIQHEPHKTQQHHDQYQQRSQQPQQQQQQQHYQTHHQQQQQQHNGDHYHSPNKYSSHSYHNINQNSHYNNSHYQYTSPSKSSDTMTTTTQLHYSNEAEDPYAPTPIQYGQQNVYSYSNSNYNHSNTSNTASHGWNNSTYQTNTNIQPSQQSYNYSQYQTVAPNNAQTQNQSYVNQTSQSWVSYRTQEANRQLELQRNAERQRQMAEQQRRMEEQKRQQEAKRLLEEERRQQEAKRLLAEERRQQEAKRLLEEERRRREQSRLQEQQAKFQQRRMRELRLQQEQLLGERILLEQKKQQRLLQQKPQFHQVSNNNIDPIPQKSLAQVATKPLIKPHDEMFQKSSPLISKNGNNKHNSDIDKEAPKKDTVILALKTDGFSNEEIVSMPVVFAFIVDDANSISKATERQTKWNGKMREKRIIKTTTTKKVKFSNKSGPKLVSEGPAGPDLPNGWTTKVFRRMSGKSKGQTDQYWFSAKTQKKMRSKVEIDRFLSYLKSSDGDEEKAFALLKRR